MNPKSILRKPRGSKYFGKIIRICGGCLIVSAAHGAEQPAEEPSGLEAKSIALAIAENEPVSPDYARRLVWSDEFDGAALDPVKWFAEIGDGSEYTVPGSITEEFHRYALEWDPREIRWYVDGVRYAVQRDWFSGTEPFPAPMEIDYIRVYSGAPEPQ